MTLSITPKQSDIANRDVLAILTIIGLWALVPEARRLVDWRLGFAGVSLVSIIPLVALIVPLLALLYRGHIARIDRSLLALGWVWFGGFTSALLVSIVSGNDVGAAVYSFAEFCLPAAFGLWVASLDLDRPALFERIATFLLGLATPLALYAMFQLAYPPAWDVAWMQHAQVVSIGIPAPFQFRPFSTLNGPGTFADFLLLALLFNLPRLRRANPVVLAQVAVCGGALALTMVRSDWLALALGIACYLVLSPNRLANLSAFGLALIVVCGLTVALPSVLGSSGLGGGLGSRFSSLSDLNGDTSYADRLGYLGAPLQTALQTPQGSGLGVLGTAAKLGSSGATKDFDNGYIARLTEMGWFGTACYLLATIGAFAFVLARRSKLDPGVVAVVAAVQIALIALDASSDHHVALTGVVFWLTLALVSGRVRRA